MQSLGNVPKRVFLTGSEPGSSLDVYIQDQHSEGLDLSFLNVVGTFSLLNPMSLDDESFTAAPGHSIAIGHVLQLNEGVRTTQAVVTNVVGDVITINVPSDYAFTVAGCQGVNGSITPQIFSISTKYLTGVEWDIISIIFGITDNSPMDDALFGGISALTKGVVVRIRNTTQNKNIANLTQNLDFALHGVLEYSNKAPSGFYGLRARGIFNGQTNNGITLRLTHTDELQIIVRDDLSALTSFYAIAKGHVVEN